MSDDVRLANTAWESLMRAHAVVTRSFESCDSWGELSMREYDVIYTLHKSGEPLNVTQLNQNVLLSQPALSRLIDRLVAQGLVEKTADSKDARNVKLRLTELGEQHQRRIGRRHARDVFRALKSLDSRELKLLEAMCWKIASENTAEGSTR